MKTYADIKAELTSLGLEQVFDDQRTLERYSTDASIFRVVPSLVIWPQSRDEVSTVIKYVSAHKHEVPHLSITARSAGTDMSGGPLGESIILDFTKHFHKFKLHAEDRQATVEPGLFYRDFEKATLKHNLILPCYTASKNLCALGGMLANNSGGEKTLRYGKMEDYIESMDVVLRDGSTFRARPVLLADLRDELATGAVGEGRRTFFAGNKLMKRICADLLEIWDHEPSRRVIEGSRPRVSKNSSGYYLWNLVRKDGEGREVFDLTRLLVGSQGTLCMIVGADIRLVPVEPESELLVIFLRDIENLGKIVGTILKHKPDSLESYDDNTIRLAMKYIPELLMQMKGGLFKIAWSFLPEAWVAMRGGIPKLVLLVEITGDDRDVIEERIEDLRRDLLRYHSEMLEAKTREQVQKYWTIRRESFNLLRKHLRRTRTAPFIDDVCVPPERLPEFLPKFTALLDDAGLVYTIAGHAGNGNFHIIPLMDMRLGENRARIVPISESVYNLVAEFGGTLSAEHNDGIVRTPFLHKIFSEAMLGLFKQVKTIFDTANIFNPGKKVGVYDTKYLEEHIDKRA